VLPPEHLGLSFDRTQEPMIALRMGPMRKLDDVFFPVGMAIEFLFPGQVDLAPAVLIAGYSVPSSSTYHTAL